MSPHLQRKVMTAITAFGLVAGLVSAAQLPVQAAITQMVYGGGPVESITDNVAVFWGSTVQAQPYFSSVPGFLQALSTNTSYVASLSEYSTPTQPITSLSRYIGAYTITPSNTSTTLQDSDIRAELSAQIAGGHLPAPTSTKNYFLMFPTGTIVCIQTGVCSNNAICAYHNPMTVSSVTFDYIVLPDESGAAGGCGSQSNDKLGTIWASIQLVNTITDPAPNTGWSDPLVGEVADPCTSNTNTGVLAGFTVMKWWSNTLNACTLSNPNREPSLAAILPAIANAAYGGYTTRSYIQDTGTSATPAAIIYFDSSGNLVGTGDQSTIQPNGTWIVDQSNGHSVASGQAGSALVYSTEPLASFVNEFAPGSGDATSYTGINGFAGPGTTLFAPTIVNNAYGGYTTGIGLVNVSLAPANVSISYRDGAGTLVRTQILPGLAAGAYQGLFSGDPALALPNGFAGTATITSSAGVLAAVVNETGPGGQFSSFDALNGGSTTLYAPAALRNAYGGYNTGIGVQNTTGTAGTVTMNYYDSNGAATGTTTASIAANGYVGVYQGTDIAADGAYTAKITSTVAIAAVVNEVAPSSTSAHQSTAYNTFVSGSVALYLPLVESTGSDGWSTGEGIMNTGTVVANIAVTYYDTSTGATLGTPQNISLQPNAFWGLYQPTGGLPGGDRASAAVHTLGGQIAVICNESNATSFMSYNGQ